MNAGFGIHIFVEVNVIFESCSRVSEALGKFQTDHEFQTYQPIGCQSPLDRENRLILKHHTLLSVLHWGWNQMVGSRKKTL